jgi:hypothetical protein
MCFVNGFLFGVGDDVEWGQMAESCVLHKARHNAEPNNEV